MRPSPVRAGETVQRTRWVFVIQQRAWVLVVHRLAPLTRSWPVDAVSIYVRFLLPGAFATDNAEGESTARLASRARYRPRTSVIASWSSLRKLRYGVIGGEHLAEEIHQLRAIIDRCSSLRDESGYLGAVRTGTAEGLSCGAEQVFQPPVLRRGGVEFSSQGCVLAAAIENSAERISTACNQAEDNEPAPVVDEVGDGLGDVVHG